MLNAINGLITVSDADDEVDHHAPHDGEYVGTIEVVVLRCYPAEPAKSSKALGFLDKDSSSPAGHLEDNEVPLLTGAMFDRSNDRKPGPFTLDGSGDDPPLKKTQKSAKSAKPLQPNQRRNSRDESREDLHVDWGSTGAPGVADRGRSHQPRRTSIPQSPPILGLRGGGPGSYSISPAPGSPEPSTKARNNQQPASSGWGPNRSTQPLITLPDPGAKNTAWQDMGGSPQNRKKSGSKKYSTGSYTPEPTMPGAWGSTNSLEQGNLGSSKATNNQTQGKENYGWGASNNPPKEIKPWDPLSNPTEKRDAWGELITDPVEERKWDDSVGNSAWNVPKNSPTGKDNGWAAVDRDKNGNAGKNTIQDTRDQRDDTWGAKGNGTGNPPNKNWHGGNGNDSHQHVSWDNVDVNKNNQRGELTTGNGQSNGSISNWNDDAKDTPQAAAGAKRSKKSSTLSLGESNAKASNKESASKEDSFRPKIKSPFTFQWLSKSSPQKQSHNLPIKASTPPMKKVSLLGSWSPPLVPKARKQPSTVIPEFRESERKVGNPKAGSSSSNVAAPKPKPYWASWNHKPDTEAEEEEDIESGKAPLAEPLEEPVYSLPAHVAERNRTSHQVRPGCAAAYTHKISTPKYMDTHQDPYAVFVFRYRDQAIIEDMFNTIITEPEAEEKDRLASLPKRELVEELVKAKRKLSLASEIGGSDKLTWKSNPNGMNGAPDLAAADAKLKTFESTGGNGWIGENDAANGHSKWGNDDQWNETSNEVDKGWGDNNSDNEGNANDNNWKTANDAGGKWDTDNSGNGTGSVNDGGEATAGPNENTEGNNSWDNEYNGKDGNSKAGNGWNSDKNADNSWSAGGWGGWEDKDQNSNAKGASWGGGSKKGESGGWGNDQSGDDKIRHNHGSWGADTSDGRGDGGFTDW